MLGYAVGLSGAKDTAAVISDRLHQIDTLVLIAAVYYFLSVGVCLMSFLSKYGFSKE